MLESGEHVVAACGEVHLDVRFLLFGVVFGCFVVFVIWSLSSPNLFNLV